MKRTTKWIWIAALLPVLLSSVACKQSEVVEGSVSVMVSAGVSGSPAAGDITLNVGDTLAYKYTLEAGYAKLTVLLDGTEVAASGTITITGDHILKAYADDNLEYKLTVTLKDGRDRHPGRRHLLLQAGDAGRLQLRPQGRLQGPQRAAERLLHHRQRHRHHEQGQRPLRQRRRQVQRAGRLEPESKPTTTAVPSTSSSPSPAPCSAAPSPTATAGPAPTSSTTTRSISTWSSRTSPTNMPTATSLTRTR